MRFAVSSSLLKARGGVPWLLGNRPMTSIAKALGVDESKSPFSAFDTRDGRF
jgi:hypothetical protein